MFVWLHSLYEVFVEPFLPVIIIAYIAFIFFDVFNHKPGNRLVIFFADAVLGAVVFVAIFLIASYYLTIGLLFLLFVIILLKTL